jgi:hypothetical protein
MYIFLALLIQWLQRTSASENKHSSTPIVIEIKDRSETFLMQGFVFLFYFAPVEISLFKSGMLF